MRHIIVLFLALVSAATVNAEFRVPVVVGDGTAKVVVIAPDDNVYSFILDTGSDMTILGKTMFYSNIRHLPGVYEVGMSNARIANGTTIVLNIYRIPYLKFSEDCTITNVLVAVNTSNELNLIGMSAFKSISPITLDIENGTLIGGRCG